MSDGEETRWEKDCERFRGAVLRGRFAHWCPDWDYLPVDETCPEWESCFCFDQQEAGE